MAKVLIVAVDAQGRLAIPQEVSRALNVEPGDTFLLQCRGSVLRYVKAKGHVDDLGSHVIRDRRDSRVTANG